MNKVVAGADEAIADVSDGASIMFGGFGFVRDSGESDSGAGEEGRQEFDDDQQQRRRGWLWDGVAAGEWADFAAHWDICG